MTVSVSQWHNGSVLPGRSGSAVLCLPSASVGFFADVLEVASIPVDCLEYIKLGRVYCARERLLFAR